MIDLIIMLVTLAGFVPANVTFGIDQNYFAYETTPINLAGTSGPLTPWFPNVTWNNSSNNTDLTWDAHINADPPYWVSCGIGFGETIKTKGKQKPLSGMDTSIDSCQTWFNWAVQNENNVATAPLVIDTMEHYVETCAKTDTQYQDGIGIVIGEGNWDNGPGTNQSIRAFLESVMARDKSQEYLCGILGGIVQTYEDQIPSDYNDAVTVLDYIICCSPCILRDSVAESSFWQDRAEQRIQEDIVFQDTVRDSLLTPIDTSEPTMHDLGLDSLVQYFGELSVQNANVENIISNATANPNPNPTGEGTVISFGISQEAYVKIELFDILGHEVGSAGFESLFEPGNKSVPLSLAGLPSGTYFARILTAYGEAQSVKLVKE